MCGGKRHSEAKGGGGGEDKKEGERKGKRAKLSPGLFSPDGASRGEEGEKGV